VTAVEFAVAINLKLTSALTGKAMWAGAILWTAIVLTGWGMKLFKDNVPTWPMICFTLLAAGSVAGLWASSLGSYARMVNAVIWALFLFAGLMSFRQNCREQMITQRNA